MEAERATGRWDDWRRSWWLVFTLAPFGLLACAAFAYAGKRAARRDWIAWAVAYLVLFWPPVVAANVGGVGEGVRQAGGLVMVVGWPVAVVHAFLIRRAYLDTAPPPEPMTLRAWVDGPLKAAGLTTFGAFLTATGVYGVVQWEPVGAVGVALGLCFVLLAPLYRPRSALARPIAAAIEGTAERGLVFEFAVAKLLAAGAALVCFALALAALAAWPESFRGPEALLRAAGVAGAGACVWAAAAYLRMARSGHLALTPSGIRVEQGAVATFVPWGAVTRVEASEMRITSTTGTTRVAFLGIFVADRSAIETTGPARFLKAFGPRRHGDVALSTRLFTVAPALVVETVEHYWEHPAERPALGSPGSLGTFERLAARAAGS